MKEPRTPEEVWEAAKLAADQGHDPDGIAPIAAYGELCRRAPDAAALRGLVRELREILALCDPEGSRARGIQAPEDSIIGELCERIGYGAVIDSAARQWWLKDSMGAHTAGPSAGTVRKAIASIADALAGEPGETRKHTDLCLTTAYGLRCTCGAEPGEGGERSYSVAELREGKMLAFMLGAEWNAMQEGTAGRLQFYAEVAAEALRRYPDVPPAPKAGEEER